jgi:hypothetical protein
MATTIANLGQVHYRLGEVRQAEELGREALYRIRAVRRSGPLAADYAAYGITLIRLSRSAEAEALLVQALTQASADGSSFWVAYAAFSAVEHCSTSDAMPRRRRSSLQPSDSGAPTRSATVIDS